MANVTKVSDFTIAIDFGTANSGVAYCKGDDESTLENIQLGHEHSIKVPTSILLERLPPHEIVAFGHDCMNELEDDSPHLLFHHFKMQLYQDEGYKTLKANIGDGSLSTKTVIAQCLRYFKDKAFERILERYGVDLDGNYEAVQWVLTVPAIWSESSKKLMRSAAFEAGLIADPVSHQLCIALEPECAALATKRSMTTVFSQGCTFGVIDCGGGTIDTTIHTIESLEPFVLRERHAASGGGWGSTRLDEAFRELLVSIFGDLDSLKLTHPSYFEVLDTWEQAKTSFQVRSTKDEFDMANLKMSVFPIMPELQEKGIDIQAAVKAYNSSHPEDKIRFMRQDLMIPGNLLNKLAKPSVDFITEHAKFMKASIPDLSFFLMVGGFARSPLVKHAMDDVKKAHPDVTVVYNPDMSMAVVRGAVLFGLYPRAITQRICPSTYGLQIARIHRSGESHEGTKVINGKRYVMKAFRTLVQAGDIVDLDQVATYSFMPSSAKDKYVALNLYCSPEREVERVTDPSCKLVGKIKAKDIVPGKTQEENKFTLEVQFGSTEMKCTFVMPNGTRKSVPLTLDDDEGEDC